MEGRPPATEAQTENTLVVAYLKIQNKAWSYERQAVGLRDRIERLRNGRGRTDSDPEITKRLRRLERIEGELIPRVNKKLTQFSRGREQ